MANSLQDKVIVVTGAGRGIGREIALLCAAEGAKVVVNDPGVAADGSGTDAAPAEQVVEEIRKAGGTAVANFDSVAEALAAAKLGIVGLSKSIALDMSRFHVRSNCISPFAWSRLIGTIPTETPEEKARVERMQQMGPEKIAALAVYLLGDAAKDVTGQIFAVRMNEIFLMGQSRPIRSIHRGEGWTPQSIAEHGMPALKSSFYKLDRSADIFNWDAV